MTFFESLFLRLARGPASVKDEIHLTRETRNRR